MDGNIQNGAPDAIGIIRTSTGELVDALSYEGSVTSGKVTVGQGSIQLNFVEGDPANAVDGGTSQDYSIIRVPNGSDTNDAASDWRATTTVTPGTANVLT